MDKPPSQNVLGVVIDWLSLAWAFGLAAFAGLVDYLQPFAVGRADQPPPSWRWAVFFAKCTTAGFVGLITHWLLEGVPASWDLSEGFKNFSIAVAGFGGAETIVFFQGLLFDFIRRAAKNQPNP